ncbi:MAG: hypothetical protein QXD48_03845 [Candidatus Aenigmatarchaeota archaeon]
MKNKNILDEKPYGINNNEIILELLNLKNEYYQKSLSCYFIYKSTKTITSDARDNIFNYISCFITLYNNIRPELEKYLKKNHNAEFLEFNSKMSLLLFTDTLKNIGNINFISLFEFFMQHEKTLNNILNELGFTRMEKEELIYKGGV